MEDRVDTRFNNRYEFPLGDGNRKSPAADSESRSLLGSNHLAISQVAQELPLGDFLAWRNGLFASETSLERQERLENEAIRGANTPEDSRTIAHAQKWAVSRHKR